jgi:hypothetical protein
MVNKTKTPTALKQNKMINLNKKTLIELAILKYSQNFKNYDEVILALIKSYKEKK